MSFSKFMKPTVAILLILFMLFIISQADFEDDSVQESGMNDLGTSLFEDNYLPFVLLSLVLFAAMMGSVFIAKERDE